MLLINVSDITSFPRFLRKLSATTLKRFSMLWDGKIIYCSSNCWICYLSVLEHHHSDHHHARVLTTTITLVASRLLLVVQCDSGILPTLSVIFFRSFVTSCMHCYRATTVVPLVHVYIARKAAQCIVIAPLCVFVCLWVRLTTAFAFAFASPLSAFSLHCALAAAQCIIIGPVCGFVCLWVCYHDKSKFNASIFTKLGL